MLYISPQDRQFSECAWFAGIVWLAGDRTELLSYRQTQMLVEHLTLLTLESTKDGTNAAEGSMKKLARTDRVVY